MRPDGADVLTVTMASGERRRSTDPVGLRGLAVVVAAHLDAISGGRCLLAFAGAGVGLDAVMLRPPGVVWDRLAWLSLAMGILLLMSFLVPWHRLPRGATAGFPLSVLAAFAVLGVVAPALTGALTGLLIATYLYVGLTQRPGSSVWIVPSGCVAFVTMNGGLSGPVVVRLTIGVFMWTAMVETLAMFTERQHHWASALEAAAHIDVLTGVPNRRDLHLRLTTLQPADALVLCDLDHFKAINDTRGHQEGDAVLTDFGSLLRLHLRAGDYCARYGGEEFVLILPNTDDVAARAVVDRLRDAWRLMRPTVTFSAGVALSSGAGDPALALANADRALYAAKASGRNATRHHLAEDRFPMSAA